MKVRKIVISILVFAFILAVLWLGAVLIRASDERMVVYTARATRSTGTESVTTYSFDDGALIGRVSALGVSADASTPGSLQGRFDAALANRRNHAIKVRGMKAISRGTGEALEEFHFSFEKETVAPGQQYTFSGAVPVSTGFFNKIIRKYDVALKVATDIGALELPLEIYTLDIEAALAAGLITTNQVSFGEAEGMIHFLNCEQAAPEQVCEQMFKRMGVAPAP